jgi:adhesin/invasin
LALAGLLVALLMPMGRASAAGPGAPATVTVALSPSCIHATTNPLTPSHSTATATVKDSNGLPLPGRTDVSFGTDASGPAAVTFGAVTDNHDGTYSVTITSSATPGPQTISANTGGVTGAATLTQSTAATTVTLAVSQTMIRANGTSTATATATVTDSAGRCVGGDAVTFNSSPAGGPTFGTTTDHGNGTYTATLTSSTNPGPFSVQAHDAALNSNTVTVTQFGPTATIAVVLTPSTVTANGTDTSAAKATFTDSGGRPVTDLTPTFTTNGDVTFGPITNNHDGSYSTTITASKTADTETITAGGDSKTGTASLTENPGPAATVAVVLTPSSIPADGASHSAAKATVKDANNNLVPTETVGFTTSGDVTFGTVTNNGDGTYSSQITASTTADTETITAKTSNNKSGTATLTEAAGSSSTMTLVLSPASIPNNGTSTSTATATIKDSNGNGVPNVTVGFGTNGDVTFSPTSATTNSSGVATSTIKASTTADKETITATGGGKSATATLTEFGPASTVGVTVTPSSIAADGAAHSTAKATVNDANGNPVLNETVVFSTSGDVTFGSVTNNGDGTYTSQITASKTADQETITAKTSNNKTGTATLTENPGTPVVTVTLTPSSIPADGSSQSTAKAKVADSNGNPFPNDTVLFTTSGDVTIGATTNHHDGTYTATIVASKTADQETITATDSTQTKTGTATLTETPSGTGFHSLPPTRILDTRAQGGGGALQPNSARKVQITGAGGVPATHVSGVVLNLTATQASTQTFLTVFPSGSPPNSSNLNIPAGRDAANLVTAQLASDGSVQLYNAQGTVHAIFDVVGYYDDGSVASAPHYTALTPSRILDTRTASGGGPVGANSTRKVQITGQGGVPASHVSAVAVNVTGVAPTAGTFLTVFPSGTVPTASNINLQPGENRPNLVMVPVASDGSVQIYNAQGSTDVIFDVAGYFDDGSLTTAKGFTALAPSRILDTRSGSPLGAGQSRTVTVAGHGGVPATGATAVVINVTATQATDGTFLTVFPQAPRPTVSNLNVPPGTDIPNLVVATLAPDGTVQLYNDQGSVHAIFDVVGWFGS